MNKNLLNEHSNSSHQIIKKPYEKGLFRVFVSCVLFTFTAFSLSAQTPEQVAARIDNDTQQLLSIKDRVVPIGTEYQNSIQLLDNRFRIDSDISAVTLVFFREFGTAPIVLVRPDGSKLFLENDSADDSFSWFETSSYDMISLISPMPGPWQAVGSILPESRVMVIADITLNASPIPDIVFSGETLKQTASLENSGSEINMGSFRDVVALSIDFVSTNNPDYPNFGLGSRSIARFEDNGLGFDEVDGDGIFTGQFDLQVTQGEWQPIFTVRTPLFSRTQVNEKIVLLPNPIIVSHTLEYNEQKDHQVLIDADPDYIDINTMLVDGNVRQPNGESVRFSITELSDSAKTVDILNTEFGIYKISMTVFAQTNSGRDLIIKVPEYSFVTEPKPIIVEPEEIFVEAQIEPIVIEMPEEASSPVLLIIMINLSLLVFGGLGLYLIVDKRNNPNNHFSKKILKRLKSIKLKKGKADKGAKR